MHFTKETIEIIRQKFEQLKKQIDELKNHSFEFKGVQVTVEFKVFHTLFDGKCVNAILNNDSSVTCAFCWITSSKFNKTKQPNVISEEALSLGLATLHGEIKSFEHLLHLSYRKTVKRWICRGENKGIFVNKFYTWIVYYYTFLIIMQITKIRLFDKCLCCRYANK